MKILLTLILIGSISGIVFAQTLTQAVNNQISGCQAQAETDSVLINQTNSRLQALLSDYATQQSCISSYTTVISEAQNADLQVAIINQLNALPVQGTVSQGLGV